MTLDEVTVIVTRSLRETLGAHGFERAEVEAGADHDGLNALFVTAHFSSDSSDSARPLLHAMGALRQDLLDCGEERFPYLRSAFPNEDLLADDETTAH